MSKDDKEYFRYFYVISPTFEKWFWLFLLFLFIFPGILWLFGFRP